jgi:hypothetical protein
MQLQSLDLFLFGLQHLRDEEHFPFLLNEFVPILSILGSFNGYCEPCCFSHVDLLLYLGVNCQSRGLYVSFANFPQTAFPRRTVFLPDLHAFIVLSLNILAVFLFLLEGEDFLIRRNLKWIVILILVILRVVSISILILAVSAVATL